MHLLLVAATPFEIAPTLLFLEKHFTQNEDHLFEKAGLYITPLVTGVGSIATAWRLGQFLAVRNTDWVLNAGIAGALDRSLHLGDVVQVTAEQFGDLGIEMADGRFSDLFHSGLCDPNTPPFINGILYNPAAGQAGFLPSVNGLTVNRVHGYEKSIEASRAAFPMAQVESMEGAAIFYGCLLASIPFVEIRSISNYVESRNRENWQLAPAIDNLNRILMEIIEGLASDPAQTAG